MGGADIQVTGEAAGLGTAPQAPWKHLRVWWLESVSGFFRDSPMEPEGAARRHSWDAGPGRPVSVCAGAETLSGEWSFPEAASRPARGSLALSGHLGRTCPGCSATPRRATENVSRCYVYLGFTSGLSLMTRASDPAELVVSHPSRGAALILAGGILPAHPPEPEGPGGCLPRGRPRKADFVTDDLPGVGSGKESNSMVSLKASSRRFPPPSLAHFPPPPGDGLLAGILSQGQSYIFMKRGCSAPTPFPERAVLSWPRAHRTLGGEVKGEEDPRSQCCPPPLTYPLGFHPPPSPKPTHSHGHLLLCSPQKSGDPQAHSFSF